MLAKLSEEDRKLVEAQQFCPILPDNQLGSMGVPVKLMIDGQPVFLCCAGCKEQALDKPEETLAKVDELKARSRRPRAERSDPTKPDGNSRRPTARKPRSRPPWPSCSDDDRKLAEQQRFCAVLERPAGSARWARRSKLMIDGQPVFVCCEGCREGALAESPGHVGQGRETASKANRPRR